MFCLPLQLYCYSYCLFILIEIQRVENEKIHDFHNFNVTVCIKFHLSISKFLPSKTFPIFIVYKLIHFVISITFLFLVEYLLGSPFFSRFVFHLFQLYVQIYQSLKHFKIFKLECLLKYTNFYVAFQVLSLAIISNTHAFRFITFCCCCYSHLVHFG